MDYRVTYLRIASLAAIALGLVLYYAPQYSILIASTLTPVMGLWLGCCTVAVTCKACIADPTDGFEVEFTGLTNDDCANCNDYNTTVFILDGAPVVVGTGCTWTLLLSPAVSCTNAATTGLEHSIVLQLITDLATYWEMDVGIDWYCQLGPDRTDGISFANNNGSPIDCQNLSGFTVPFSHQWIDLCSGPTQAKACGGASADALVTTH